MLAYQLEAVSISRTNQNMCAFFLGTFCYRCNDIVRFKTFDFELAYAKSFDQFVKVRHLRPKLIWSLCAVGFVFRENLCAKCFSRDIEGNGDMCRFLLFQKGDQHGRKTVDCVCVLALRRREILGWEGEESAIRHGMAIN